MKDKTKPEQRSRNNNNKGSGMKNACVFPCESRWVAPAVNPLTHSVRDVIPILFPHYVLTLYFLLTTHYLLYTRHMKQSFILSFLPRVHV